METVTIMYDAKCKHCEFLSEFYKGKLKLHKCDNPLSVRHYQQITKRDLACNEFKLL